MAQNFDIVPLSLSPLNHNACTSYKPGSNAAQKSWHISFPDTLPKSRNRDAAATVTAAEIEWSVPTVATCRFRGRRKRSVEAEKQPPNEEAAAESSSSVRAASLGRTASAKMLSL